VARGLSDLTDASIEASLQAVRASLDDAPRIGVIALGRWGGREMALSSDADLMFVVDDTGTRATQKAMEIVTTLRKLLGAPGPGPGLDLDADLRPEGRSGPLVRSLSSCLTYYSRWSSTWESQALVRARHGAGDRELTGELLTSMDRLRWPAEGLSPSQCTEIRRLKARMEDERVRRGSDRRMNLKMGPGGLADVEWTVQL
ncbi:bifunctional glutamine-synthetase adenylyltransferase/deadenyltransferase, partial [Cutibacterium acnes]